MKERWYFKHPILFGFFVPLLGIILAGLLNTIFQIILLLIFGDVLRDVRFSFLPQLLFDISRILMGLLLILIMKPRLGRGFKFGFTGSNLSLSLKLAAFGLLVVISNIIENGISEGLPLASTPTAVLSGIFQGIAPGFYEEVACRGMTLSIMMILWHDQKNGVMKSVVISGLCFGLMHIVNLLSADPVLTIIQLFYATSLGVFFGGVYARTRNLWGPVIVHTLIDIAEFIYVGEASLTTYSMISAIVITVLYAALGLYFVRPSKQDEIRARGGK